MFGYCPKAESIGSALDIIFYWMIRNECYVAPQDQYNPMEEEEEEEPPQQVGLYLCSEFFRPNPDFWGLKPHLGQ